MMRGEFFVEHTAEKKDGALRRVFLNLAEIALLVLLAGFVVWIYFGDATKDVEISGISEAIIDRCGLGELEAGDANTLKRYFSLDGAEYEGYMVYTAASLMNVEELLIVKVSDDDQFNALETAVNERLEEQINNFDGYGTEQMELLNHAVITERGDYFFYCVSENAAQWEEVFLSVIQ